MPFYSGFGLGVEDEDEELEGETILLNISKGEPGFGINIKGFPMSGCFIVHSLSWIWKTAGLDSSAFLFFWLLVAA
ncbi:MAG: hypothetical protein NTZ52_02665 [Chlamydiae bacterium]|nr:hypothetical protein [Chlamydiota bacterium]